MPRSFNNLLHQMFHISRLFTQLFCAAALRLCTATAVEVGEAHHPHNSTSLGEMGRLDTLLEEASMVVAFQTEVVGAFVVEEASKEVFLKGSLVERLIEEASNQDLDMTFRT